MFGTHDLALFIVSGLLLNIAPGPDSLLVMTRGASQGFRAGSAAALGIGAGTFVHIIGAALGLSAVLATSAAAFVVVKWIGAAYLVYIGVALLLSQARRADMAARPATPPLAPLSFRRIFAQGFLTNALNPKVAIFFLAFVPQFISPQAPNKALAFVALGFIFNINGMLWCHLLAASAAFASRRIRANASLVLWLNRFIGAMFIGLGIKLALADRA